MTIPSLDPILDAVRDVRAQLEPNAADLATSIPAGDAVALDVGQELRVAVEKLTSDLADLIDDGFDVDGLDVERLLGVRPVIDAVLVATGEIRAAEDDSAEIAEIRAEVVQLAANIDILQASIRGMRPEDAVR